MSSIGSVEKEILSTSDALEAKLDERVVQKLAVLQPFRVAVGDGDDTGGFLERVHEYAVGESGATLETRSTLLRSERERRRERATYSFSEGTRSISGVGGRG